MLYDIHGNSERLAHIFDRAQVTSKQLFGEVALHTSDFPKRKITVKFNYYNKSYIFEDLTFEPFDRNTYSPPSPADFAT